MTKTQRRRRSVAAPSLIAVLLGVVVNGRARNPDALWHIVHDQMCPQSAGSCRSQALRAVDLRDGDRGYVIFKDLVGPTQYLLIPVARLAGIESAALLMPGAPNYFADAWRERSYTERATGHPLPRDAISLAINSASGRTQNELHIHIDCIRADVRAALLRRQATIGDDWAAFVEPLAGHRYRVMRVVADSLDAINPFVLLADRVPGAKRAMGRQTLVVVGADLAPAGPASSSSTIRSTDGAGRSGCRRPRQRRRIAGPRLRPRPSLGNRRKQPWRFRTSPSGDAKATARRGQSASRRLRKRRRAARSSPGRVRGRAAAGGTGSRRRTHRSGPDRGCEERRSPCGRA